jgi:hypothetical protein
VSEDFLPPVFFDRVLDDPGLVRDLLERNGPYAPVQRYFGNDVEYRASAGTKRRGAPMIIAPNFRGDWAYERPLIDGVEPLLQHEGFVKAAGELFGADLVEPFSVYSNITWQLPFDQGAGHTDVPEFRGFDRTRYPTTLLSVMGHSRLFEDERIQIATAVAWFYRGDDGGFTYWPDGPDAPPRVHEGQIFNTALEADNERMYHRVRPVGRREDGMLTDLTLDARLTHRAGDEWAIVDGARTRACMDFESLRVSISWKARVFRSEEERRLREDHSRDLDEALVFDRFHADLDARGIDHPKPAAPVYDPGLMEVLSTTYMRTPVVFDSPRQSAPRA